MLSGTLAHLIVPSAIFLGIHVFVSGTPLRGGLVRRAGQRAYLVLFALVSLASLIWMMLAYRGAPVVPLWHAQFLAWPAVVVMPFAMLLAVAGYTTRNPMAFGTDLAVLEVDNIATGIIRVTRHPFLWSVVLWASVHLLVNGDLASLIFFGTFLIIGVAGPHLIDAKKRATNPAAWERLAAVTSNLPLAAAASGRTRVTLGEIGWWRIALAALAYGAFAYAHDGLFGVPVLT